MSITEAQFKAKRRVYRSKVWAKARAAALRRAGRRCQDCGRVGRLEVHHVKPLVDGGHPFKLSNLRVVCRDCHFVRDRQARAESAAAADPQEAARQEWVASLDGAGAPGSEPPAPPGTREARRQEGARRRQRYREAREARAPAPAPAPESTGAPGGEWGSMIV